jgi:alginate O-acetyltransferase complex protein AlgI
LLFNSVDFLIFFPFVTFLYFIIPHKFRWIWLLISSYFFYMCWNPKYAILMGTSTLITYLSGLLIENANEISDEKKSIQLKKLWVFISFTSNLGILFVFKYFNFLTENFMIALSWLNISIVAPAFDFLLPVGISFYTFQALSYTMDVYRKDIKAEKNLGKYALFVSFFPQLVAGPIEKSKDLLHQFNEKHSFDYDRAKSGLSLMLWGFFQKIFIADRLAVLVNTVYNDPKGYKGFEIVIATVFFAFQIYCDFSSYSDIARGSAEVMGFRLTKNFEQPYFSKSIKEFWRRWHITLGSWFRDYLYIPLGGSRCSRARTYFNVMVVFLTSGLWHGAAMNFVIWGGLHGIYQVLGDVFKPAKEKVIKTYNIKTDVLSYKLFQILATFVLVNFAWIFFRASTFLDAKTLISNMMYFNPWIFTNGSIYKLGLDPKDFLLAILGISIVIVINTLQTTRSLRIRVYRQNTVFRWALYLTAIVVILMFGIYGPGYSAQQFIYFQF